MSKQKEQNLLKIYSWRDLQGNKFRLTPKAEWLSESESIAVEDLVRGEQKRTGKRELKIVVYDAEYVAAWIYRKLSFLPTEPDLLSDLFLKGKALLNVDHETDR